MSSEQSKADRLKSFFSAQDQKKEETTNRFKNYNSNYRRDREEYDTYKQYMYQRPKEVYDKPKQVIQEPIDTTDTELFPSISPIGKKKEITLQRSYSSLINKDDKFTKKVNIKTKIEEEKETTSIHIIEDKDEIFKDLLANKKLDEIEVKPENVDEDGFTKIKKNKKKSY